MTTTGATYARRWFLGLVAAVTCTCLTAPLARAAVSSTGEINVVGDPSGIVPTASSPTLILTLLVDRSQAEPGEEIKTIEVQLPPGFVVTPTDIGAVRIDTVVVGFQVETSPNAVRFVLDDEIDNFLSSVIEIDFVVRTPESPTPSAEFGVVLRNPSNAQIGDFVKPGEIDGDPTNNNDYTLRVIPNIPPAAPTGVQVAADPDGENDAIVTWDAVPDPDVQGYFVFRGDGATFEAVGANTTLFRDVNAPPGTNEYSVAAFKSRLVVSDESASAVTIVPPDTKAPNPVPVLSVEQSVAGLRIIWRPSDSPDVVRYDLMFGRADTTPTLLDSRFAADLPEIGEFEFTHRDVLPPGRYLYQVLAVDENENASQPREHVLALLDRPHPNPFTPLGAAPFDTVTFPTRAVADGVGDLVVRIFDLHGRQVWESAPSTGDVRWDGLGSDGTLAPGGVYAYQMEMGGQFRIGSIVLIR